MLIQLTKLRKLGFQGSQGPLPSAPAVTVVGGRRFSSCLSRELPGCSLRKTSPCWRQLLDDSSCLGDTDASYQ